MTVLHCSVCRVSDCVFSAAWKRSTFAWSLEPGARSRFIGSGSISVFQWKSLSLRSTHKRCSSRAFSLCVTWWHVKLDALASYGTIYIGGEEIYELTDHFLLKTYVWASIRQDSRRRDRIHWEEKRPGVRSPETQLHRMSERCP